MISDFISLGDRLDLNQAKKKSSGSDSKVYLSQILDIVDDETLNIAMPMEHGRVIPLSVDELFDMRIYTQKGLYQTKVKVTDRFRKSNIFILVVHIESNLVKQQRREFYRLQCLMDVKYREISEQELLLETRVSKGEFETEEDKQNCIAALDKIKNEYILGTVLDISGGGVRFLSNKQHEKTSTIQLSLQFPDNPRKVRLIKGEIIASVPMISNTGKYEHRSQFRITKDERESIIKFIFEEERRQRKKG